MDGVWSRSTGSSFPGKKLAANALEVVTVAAIISTTRRIRSRRAKKSPKLAEAELAEKINAKNETDKFKKS